MSDAIHHECGIVQIRLLKPLSFYNSDHYGLNKLYLMMEKQFSILLETLFSIQTISVFIYIQMKVYY